MIEKTQENSIPLAEMELGGTASSAPLSAAPRHHVQTESVAATTPAGPRGESRKDSLWMVWLGNTLSFLWIGATIAYAVGFQEPGLLQTIAALSYTQLGGLALFILVPALLFSMCGMLAREVTRSADTAGQLDHAVRRLSSPASNAEYEVRTLSSAVTGEVERINAALESALARLAAMEEIITHHADTLEQSAGDARDRTEGLLSGLRKERLRLGEVSESLDDKAALIAEAISDQSKMVAAAAELAASQAGDSERRIRSSIEGLSDASDSLSERGDILADKLGARAAGLRELSDSLTERSEGLDTAYTNHRKRLADAGEALRKEQEKIAAALDFHRAELDVMATTARGGAEALNEAASDGASAFRDAVESAFKRSSDLAGKIRSESDHAAREHESSLARLVAAAQEAKSVSTAAIEAIEQQADVIADKVERTNEAAFDAARRSDETFEIRMNEAEKITARASQAADDAAESVRRRLEAVLASARAETQTVERHIDTMTDRLGELPVMARERSQEAADTLRRGLEGLNSAALAAAEEAQEIDAAFQARIRQNYELLSEFMLHMGTVAGGRRPPDLPNSLANNELPAPLSRRAGKPASNGLDAEPSNPNPGLLSETDTAPEEAVSRAPVDSKVGFPERGAQPSAPRTKSEPGWRWKDLLSAMPEDDGDDTTRATRRQNREETEEN
jgi:uncharacterized protein YoxC